MRVLVVAVLVEVLGESLEEAHGGGGLGRGVRWVVVGVPGPGRQKARIEPVELRKDGREGGVS